MSLLLRVFIVSLTLCFNYLICVTSIKLRTIHKKDDVNLYNYEPKFSMQNAERRIFGGQFAKDMSSIPFMVYVLRITVEVINASGAIRDLESCGGTILDRTHILTAAHCVKRCYCIENIDDADCPSCTVYSPSDYVVFAGETVANKSKSNSSVKRIFVHPEHRYVDNKHNCSHRFDIAVLELSKPLNFSEYIKPVNLLKAVTLGRDTLSTSLLSKMYNSKKKRRRNCLVVGWGLTSLHDRTPFLQENIKVAKVPLINMTNCISDLKISRHIPRGVKRKTVCTDTDICTRSPHDKNSPCLGDSGGPILCKGVQVGVASWTVDGCAGKHIPSMFARVDVSMDWINHVMSIQD